MNRKMLLLSTLALAVIVIAVSRCGKLTTSTTANGTSFFPTVNLN